MGNATTRVDRAQHPGLISGAYLIALLESFVDIKLIDQSRLPYVVESLESTGWYPYHYLLDTITLTEEILPDSNSFLFWAGTRFMELWYQNGPGKTMLFSGMDWVYGNENGEGYRSVARGAPHEIGWTRNLVVNLEEGFALVENVMPLSAEFLRGIYYGGFLIFDDMTYFDTEIHSQTVDPNLPFPRTIIKLLFRPKVDGIWDGAHATARPDDLVEPIFPNESLEAFFRIKHLTVLHGYREKYNHDLMRLLRNSLEQLRSAKDRLQIVNENLLIESKNLLAARAEADEANKRLTEITVERTKREERDNLLKDMHDGFGSQLTYARLMAESGKMTLDELPILLQECMADLYLMADSIGNPENTLEDSLADLRFRVTNRTRHLPITILWDINLDGMSALPQRDVLQILRITQEAINNALKHSKAKNIKVQATYDKLVETFTLSISDDGLGMLDDVEKGRGILNMRRRSSALGGVLTILPNTPGTQVRFDLRRQ